MKSLFIVTLLSIFLVNCEEGDSSAETDLGGNLFQNAITEDYSALGPKAKALIDNYSDLDKFYSSKQSDGSPLYERGSLLHRIRGFVHFTSTETNVEAHCNLLRDIYIDFGVDAETILIEGDYHSIPDENRYCVVQLNLERGSYIEDPILNVIYTSSHFVTKNNKISFLNAEDFFTLVQEGLYNKIDFSINGPTAPASEWPINQANPWYDNYNKFGLNTANRNDIINSFYDSFYKEALN